MSLSFLFLALKFTIISYCLSNCLKLAIIILAVPLVLKEFHVTIISMCLLILFLSGCELLCIILMDIYELIFSRRHVAMLALIYLILSFLLKWCLATYIICILATKYVCGNQCCLYAGPYPLFL